MANHKRRRPKHQRAGCLMCKPHKDERAPTEEKASVRRKFLDKNMQRIWGAWGFTLKWLKDNIS